MSPDATVRTAGLVSTGTPTAGTLSRKNEIESAQQALAGVQGELSQKLSDEERVQDTLAEETQMLESLVDDIREKQNSLHGSLSHEGQTIQKNGEVIYVRGDCPWSTGNAILPAGVIDAGNSENDPVENSTLLKSLHRLLRFPQKYHFHK